MKSEKIGAMLTTVICTCSMFASMLSVTADAATTYNSCDVDRNGVVNILDSIALNRCLMGVDYLSDFNRMDADRSGIVNYADAQCILAKVTGNSYYSTINGTTSVFESGTFSNTYMTDPITSMEYVKYNYKTKETSNYTLEITPASDNDISTLEVIGVDDRKYLTNQSEYTGIVKIELGTQDAIGINSKFVGASTGFIVGDHQIATAAHCVYNQYNGNYEYDYYFLTDKTNYYNKIYLYDKDGNQTGTALTPIEVHIPKKYMEECENPPDPDDKPGLDGTDYALITVAEDLSEYTHFSLGLTKNPYANSFKNVDIYVSGIADYVGGKKNTDNKIATGSGKMYSNESSYLDTMLYYTTDVTQRNSGSPIYTITSYRTGNTTYNDYTAIGIVKGGSFTRNRGARIIPIMQKFYLSNPNMSY